MRPAGPGDATAWRDALESWRWLEALAFFACLAVGGDAQNRVDDPASGTPRRSLERQRSDANITDTDHSGVPRAQCQTYKNPRHRGGRDATSPVAISPVAMSGRGARLVPDRPEMGG